MLVLWTPTLCLKGSWVPVHLKREKLSVYTCDKKQMSLYFLFTAAVSMYTARQVNKKYGDVGFLQYAGSSILRYRGYV